MLKRFSRLRLVQPSGLALQILQPWQVRNLQASASMSVGGSKDLGFQKILHMQKCGNVAPVHILSVFETSWNF